MEHTPSTVGATSSTDMGFVEGLKFATELGFIIAIPACLFGYLGFTLDKMFQIPSHILLSVFLLAAIILSAVGVVKKIRTLTADACKTESVHP